jgi:subtilase family serine protease
MRRRIISLCAGPVMLAASALTTAGAAAVSAPAVLSGAGPVALARMLSSMSFQTPPTTAQCVRQTGLACYAPFQYQKAYNLGPLYTKGLNGTGETIAIVDPFGYQFIRNELSVFDKAFGLPAPPSFKIIQPAGPVPPYNPGKNPMMFGWAIETSLDVQYAHAMAPGANILLVETPVPETLGVHGFPQIVQAENFVVDHHLGTVISQSFGAPEQGFPGPQSILKLRSAYMNAAAHGVSVLGASGDAGATGARTLSPQGFADSYFTKRVAAWPATDPLVTAVGGTQLHLTASGNHTEPDTVWNDTNLFNSPSAGGGGLSAVFSRPTYQDGVAERVGSRRGIPDISMSAAVNGAALVYLNAAVGAGPAGFYLIGGTSEATPLFAGVVAIADQFDGEGLGLLNPALYAMQSTGQPGIVDVTAGTNTVTFPQNGGQHTVRGWDAIRGYDLASGLGTVNAALFVPELVAAAGG